VVHVLRAGSCVLEGSVFRPRHFRLHPTAHGAGFAIATAPLNAPSLRHDKSTAHMIRECSFIRCSRFAGAIVVVEDESTRVPIVTGVGGQREGVGYGSGRAS